jgi:hypothetical protein
MSGAIWWCSWQCSLPLLTSATGATYRVRATGVHGYHIKADVTAQGVSSQNLLTESTELLLRKNAQDSIHTQL